MPKEQTITLKEDGSTLANAVLYHKDRSHSIYLKSKAGGQAGPIKYAVLWCANDQMSSVVDATEEHDAPVFEQQQAMDRLHKKAQRTAQSRQLQLMRLSGRIDEFAMRLFMSLSKTIPCRWYFEETKISDSNAKDTAIVILDELIINPPYRLQDFIATDDANAATVEWIGKMVSREREKVYK